MVRRFDLCRAKTIKMIVKLINFITYLHLLSSKDPAREWMFVVDWAYAPAETSRTLGDCLTHDGGFVVWTYQVQAKGKYRPSWNDVVVAEKALVAVKVAVSPNGCVPMSSSRWTNRRYCSDRRPTVPEAHFRPNCPL